MRSSAGFELIDWASGRKTPVTIPAGARVSTPVWSPTGAQFAFLALFDNATQIYVADVATGATRAVTTRSTLSTNVTAPAWTADGSRLVTVLIPEARGAEPVEPKLATGPMVRLNENNKLKTRTYPDLLASPFEKALLAYHTTGQLAMIHVKTRAVTHIGTPGLIRRVDPSPDGGYFRVTYLEPPFSYLLPVASFGTREVLIDGAGRVLRELATRALREGEEPTDPSDPQPRPAAVAGAASAGRPAPVDTGKRNLIWHPFAGGLLYAQLAPAAAGTGGARPDSTTAAPAASGAARRTDRLLHWTAPFDSTGGRTLYTTANRITGVQFSDNGNILFVSETGTGGTFEQAVFLDQNNATFTVIAPRQSSSRDQGGTAYRWWWYQPTASLCSRRAPRLTAPAPYRAPLWRRLTSAPVREAACMRAVPTCSKPSRHRSTMIWHKWWCNGNRQRWYRNPTCSPSGRARRSRSRRTWI